MSGHPKNQTHQNKTAFKPNRGMVVKDRDKQALAAAFSASMAGICERCAEQVKWKHKYGKFKPIAQPRKCNGCDKKTVRATYHNLCRECASTKKVCCKCQTSPAATAPKTAKSVAEEAEELADKLAGLRERERRAAQRAIARGEKPAVLGGAPRQRREGGGGGGEGSDDDDDDSDFDDSDEESDGEGAGAVPSTATGGQAAAAGAAGGGGAVVGGSDEDEDEDEDDDNE